MLLLGLESVDVTGPGDVHAHARRGDAARDRHLVSRYTCNEAEPPVVPGPAPTTVARHVTKGKVTRRRACRPPSNRPARPSSDPGAPMPRASRPCPAGFWRACPP